MLKAPRSERPLAILTVATILAAGCVGSIGDSPDEECPGCADEEATASSPLTTRFPRLTHAQWEHTIQDLFYLPAPTGLSQSFIGDAPSGSFSNNEASLIVSPEIWADYQVAAEAVAELVTSDPSIFAHVLRPVPTSNEAEQARAFIEQLGRRAFRRPLTADEIEDHLAIFEMGRYVAGEKEDGFASGARLVIAAFLQSPHFVYRLESSSEIVDDTIPLDGYEMASKLSYFFWDTMPDEALFEAAADGRLETAEGIASEAERMMDDERARGMIASFHEQLLSYGTYDNLSKAPDLFPDFSPELGESMKTEARMFIDDVVFTGNGGIQEILTSPFTYVDAGLADVYGLEGDFSGDEFVRVELDASKRAGFLTHIGFLAANATEREQHTILRGAFINHNIICSSLPAPPDNITTPPPPDLPTNRERIEAMTGAGTCGASCHGTWINPIGYAFEHYDAIGEYQELENGYPINAADDYAIDDGVIEYDNAVELSQLLADSEQVQRCYARHWFEFAYARTAVAADDPFIDGLTDESAGSARSLILALATSAAFRSRVPAQENP